MEKRKMEMNLELEKKKIEVEQERVKLENAAPKVQTCQYCKTESKSNAKFCENCGSRFFE